MRLRRGVGALLALLVVPAAVLTYARLAERHGAWWVRLVGFAPYAVPLYLLGMLVLALAWWRAGGRARLAAKTGLVLCACALALHLSWAAPAYVGPAATSAGRGTPLRVLTANLDRGRAEAASLVATVVRERVDVLVLEEVTPRSLHRLRAAGLCRVLPHAAGRAAPGRAGVMVLARDAVVRAERLPTGLGSYVVQVRHGRFRATLVAAHVRPARGSAGAWSADLNTVRTAAATARPGPVVVAGDLEATCDHLPLRDLAGRGFRDAATEARSGWQPTWPARASVLGVRVPPLLALDHVLVGPRVTAVATSAVTVPGSDHRALLALLRL